MQESGSIPKKFEFALWVTAMLWALAAYAIAGRAAHGLTLRFRLGLIETLLTALFVTFLCWLGFQMLDWIATRRGVEAASAMPLPLRPGWPTEWGVGAGVGWGLALLAVLPLLMTRNLHAHLRLGAGNLLPVLLSLTTLLAVTLAEETIARGYALRRLSAAIGPSSAAVITSLLFSLALLWGHAPRHWAVAMLDGALLGLLLAMAYLRTHALWVGWGLHFAYRAVTALVLGLAIAGHGEFAFIADTSVGGPSWLNGGVFGLDAAWLTAPFLLLATAVLFRVTRDYAWRYTHRLLLPGGYEVSVPPPAAHTAMERQAAAAPPLVQILASTPSGFSVPPPPKPAVSTASTDPVKD